MVINEMSEQECRAFLARASVARLGCALNNQPYVVPVYFAYEQDYIYAFSTFGQKIEWMRTNPNVCIEVDEIPNQPQWRSVIATGQYQELPDSLYATERAHARQLLEKHYRWWVNALAERRMTSADELTMEPIFFRIHIDSMTGLHALAEDTAK